METIGIYSLKSALVLLLFWAVYQLFLRKETFHRFNRFFLLGGLMTALLFPLIEVHYPVVEIVVPAANSFSVTESPAINSDEAQSGFSWSRLLFFVYLSGICLSLLFPAIGLWKLGRIIRKHGYQTYPAFYLVESSPYETSFSFFSFIFLPESVRNELDRRIILNHEKAHIMQKHWIDLLVSTVFRILWWFNPIAWLYEKSIRENHEFLADDTVLRKHSQTDYFSVLANQWFGYSSFPLTNSFNYSTQLKRIKMMKKNISNPFKKLSVLLLVPALAIFFWAFAEPEYRIVETPNEIAVQVLTQEVSDSLLPQDTIIVNTESRKKVIIYQEGQDKKTEEEIQAIIEESHPEFKGEIISITKESGTNSSIRVRGTGTMENKPLIVIDGVPKETSFNLADINPENIKSIDILKDATAIETFGDEAKSGVIIITTKKEGDTNEGARKITIQKMHVLKDEPNITIVISDSTVQGTVLDESGKPVIGASIIIKGSKSGTVTDPSGNFTLAMEKKGIIEIIYPGYKKFQFEAGPNQKGLKYSIQLEKE